MAGHAPGYDQAAEDLQCYNCGMKGHLFFACPEDTRRVPAGLEASRKRQASSNDYPMSIKRNKGPVVTHYPPPPLLPPPPPPGVSHIPPPPTAYSPRPGYQGFHSGPPPGLPPGPPGPAYQPPPRIGQYDQYPPHSWRGAPGGFAYSSSRDAFEYPPRAPPSETPYRQSHYDHHDRHHSGPPLGAHYSRPYSAPPDRYDNHPPDFPQAPPYTTGYRDYQTKTHLEHIPPTPGTDNYHSRPPQSYPPSDSTTYQNSSHYGYDAAPPARLYTPGHGSTPSGSSSYQFRQDSPSDPPAYHARFEDRFSNRPSYEQYRREFRPQHSVNHTGEKRQNHDRYDRRSRYGSPKHRSRSERRFPDRPPRPPSPVNSIAPTQSVNDSVAPEDGRPPKDSSRVVRTNKNIADELTVEDLDWEEKTIFKELPIKVTKDLIREPLPAEWTDDPIMPPKYGKETITSRYITPTNIDDFALSIRETKAWQTMQYHPVFLSITNIRIEKIREYEKALNPGSVHNRQGRHGTNHGSSVKQRGKSWSVRARGARQHWYSQNHAQNYPSSDDSFNSFWPRPRRNSWDQDSHRGVEEPGADGEVHGREPRISSPEPGELYDTDDQGHAPTTRVTGPFWEEDNYYGRQSRRDPIVSASRDARAGPPDIVSDSDARQPSLQATPTPLPTSHPSGSPPRPPSRPSSRATPRRPSSRHSVKSNMSGESSRRSSVASPLTPTERELLGMRPYSSGSDSGPASPAPQANGVAGRSRQRPAKLHAAYQRRW